jgi:hypothetical protein
VPTRQMRAIWHPTRARIFELIVAGPVSQSELVETSGAPIAEVAYHCRALYRSGCISYAEPSGPEADNPVFQVS